MKDLEEKLRSALRRKDPPAGFAERLRARLSAPPVQVPAWKERVGLLLSSLHLRWVGAVAAVCLLVALGLWHYQRQQRLRARGEQAREQVMQALRIASVKLNQAKKMVQKADQNRAPSRL